MRSFMFDILQGDMTRSKVIITFTCLKMYIARSGDTSGSRTTLFSLVFIASIFNAIMPNTPRSMTVSTSVSALVIAPDSALASSSGSCFSSVPPCSGLIANEPLSGRQSDRDLYQKFKLFMEWEKSTLPPSSALLSFSSAPSVTVPSSRPVYSLAPSALSYPINPPRSDLGYFRPSPTLASSRGQGAHVLPGRGVPSRATRLPSSVARSGTVQSDNGGRSRASLSGGVFDERDVTMASGDPSLADYYLEDLDFKKRSPRPFPVWSSSAFG